jgi:hypothetical protein
MLFVFASHLKAALLLYPQPGYELLITRVLFHAEVKLCNYMNDDESS